MLGTPFPLQISQQRMISEPPLKDSPKAKRSVADLIKQLARDTSELIRQEIGLVKAEVRQSVTRLLKSAGEIAAGGGVAFVGLLVFIAFLVIGLGLLLGGLYWLSALIVALLLLGAGGGMAYLGVRKIGRTDVKPERTVASLGETREWAATEVRRIRGAPAVEARETPRLPVQFEEHGKVVPLESRPGSPAVGGDPDAAPSSRTSSRPPLDQPLYKRVMQEIGNDDVMGQGAKVAFYMFTSLPPMLLVAFALSGIFGGAELADFLTGQLEQLLPGSASDPNSAVGFLSQFVDQVVRANAPGPLSIGLVSGIWASSAVFVALTDALNRAYDIRDGRSWVRKRGIAIAVMIGFLALFIIGSGVLLAGPQIAGALELGGVGNLTWAIAQWPIAFLLIVGAFFLVYYVLPDRDQSISKKRLFISSSIAAGLWLLATLAFRIYIANFGSYGETYGFVGAILVLLLWMYITGVVIVLGGEIASEMEREA